MRIKKASRTRPGRFFYAISLPDNPQGRLTWGFTLNALEDTQDKPVAIHELNDEEKALIFKHYPELS